ncbi:9967_t:CDS:2 [Paraglomus brasilianum]|uniref:Nascent polypeptide-associated complex subunit beta n=1 Tax=Paraglomus brasilianum TaxID=144538 RepID=A0A9N9AW28_9GLOM|nr:9967_t:CDS:2 [Paraglomus brasilianum]
MNADKLAKMQAQVRIGGKGSPRRKMKKVHKSATNDDKKLKSALNKLKPHPIQSIDEVNMVREDGSVLHFRSPKVQAAVQYNTFVIEGPAEEKSAESNLEMLQKLNASLSQASQNVATEADDEEIPALVEDFEAETEKATDEQ